MTNTKHAKILAAAISVCVILLGILFIACCAHLYFTGGETPYSRERVGDYLLITAIPSAITVILAIVGIVYSVISERQADGKLPRTASDILHSLTERYDVSEFGEDVYESIKKERKQRKLFEIISFAVSAVIFLFVLIYFAFIAEFTIETLNADIVAALTVGLPLSVLALGIHVPRVYLAERSAAREIDIIKAYIKENGAPATKGKQSDKKEENVTSIVRYLLVGAAVALVILGIFNGGMADVFAKAVKICTECIGLG